EAFGQTQVARYQSELDKVEGATRTRLAAAGVDANVGSAAEVIDENRMVGLLNKMDIDNQARERALGYTRQAQSIRLGSRLNQLQSQVRSRAAIGGAIAGAA